MGGKYAQMEDGRKDWIDEEYDSDDEVFCDDLWRQDDFNDGFIVSPKGFKDKKELEAALKIKQPEYDQVSFIL